MKVGVSVGLLAGPSDDQKAAPTVALLELMDVKWVGLLVDLMVVRLVGRSVGP